MNYNKILIILTGSLGDIARGLFIPVSIKRAFPNSQIDWLVDSTWQDLTRLSWAIDNLIVFDRKNPIKSFPAMYRKIRHNKYDICLDLQRHMKSGVLSFISGAPRRVGFHPANSKEFNYLFNTEYINKRENNFYKFKQYQDFLEKLNIEDTAEPDFGIKDSVSKINLDKFSLSNDSNLISIVLSSSWETKNWSREGYKGLLDKLLAHNYKIVLTGGNKDLALANDLAHDPKIVNLAGRTSLSELAGIIFKSKMLIGPDSGPAHIASALGIPAISLFGPTDPARVAPYANQNNIIQVKVDCGPCNKKLCPGYNKICMNSITPDMVIDKVRAISYSS